MIEVVGRPFLTFILEALEQAGVQKAILVVGYQSETIRGYFENGRNGRTALQVSYAHQPEPNGTAGALLAAADQISGPFLLTFGDILLWPTSLYRQVIRTWRLNPILHGVLVANRSQDASAGAAVLLDSQGSVQDLIEKPGQEQQTGLNQAGCFVFTPEILPILESLPRSPRGELELTEAARRLIGSGKQVQAMVIERQNWLDIGDPDSLAAAQEALKGYPDEPSR